MEIKQLFTWIVFCLLSLNLAAQTDTIPKKNKERIFHAGIFYSVGLSTLFVKPESGFTTTSNIDLYKNWGLLIETKLYKNFWLELNAYRSLGRDGLIHLTSDTVDIDLRIKNGIENTLMLYLKYKVMQKKKINVMAKLGVGFGTVSSGVYTKDNSLKEKEYFHQSIGLSNFNYYSYSLGIDANYQVNKHIILFNQLNYNMGTNTLEKRPLGISRVNTNSLISIENVTPHTLTYSLGIKF